MIINEMAGSGGDLMPYMFRRRKIGPLVGKRTWGGLVHTADTPQFIDGGSMIAPRGGFFLQGFLVLLSNPKVLVFFGAFIQARALDLESRLRRHAAGGLDGGAQVLGDEAVVAGELLECRRKDLRAWRHHVRLQRVAEGRQAAGREARRDSGPGRRYLDRVPCKAHRHDTA
jgi:hypothetical protein